MSRTVNLTYIKDPKFFLKLQESKTRIKQLKSKHFADDDPQHAVDLERKQSFTIFKGLKEMVDRDPTMTLEVSHLRNELLNRQVVDRTFQDKILNCLFQNQIGLQVMFGELLGNYTRDDIGIANLGIRPPAVKMRVNHRNEVVLTLDINLEEQSEQQVDGRFPKIPTVSLTLDIVIAKDKIVAKNILYKQLVKTDSSNKLFDYLEKNQTTVLKEKIIICLYNFLVGNPYLGKIFDKYLEKTFNKYYENPFKLETTEADSQASDSPTLR